MVRDRLTGDLMQAWPHLDLPPEVPKKAPRGICMKCFVKEANRRCNTCFLRASRNDWNKGYAYYCFGCFADIHKDDPRLREHGFTVVKAANPPKLKCTVCNEHATRRCYGILVTEKQRQRLTELASVPKKPKEPGMQIDEFMQICLEDVGLEFTHKKLEFIYKDAGGSFSTPGSDVWPRVLKVIDEYQEACGENFCTRCWKASHQKGQRAKHVWVGFMAGWNGCVRCEKEPVEKKCEDCDDELCTACFKANHMKGRKRQHAVLELKEPVDEDEFYCQSCKRRIGSLECNDCHEPQCESCLAFVHPGKCQSKLRLPEDDELSNVEGKEYPLACSVCGKVPDTLCEDCGDVYCSNKWMGNPGCFAKMHRRGNRKQHTKAEYTFANDLITKRQHEAFKVEQLRMVAEEARARRAAQSQVIEKAVQEKMGRKHEMRQRRLMEEAQGEYRKKAKKGFFSQLLPATVRDYLKQKQIG